MRESAEKLLKSGAFLPAMPLVLSEQRQFDEEGQRRLTRYYLEAGTDGIAAAVHTTQFAIRDPKIDLFEKVLTVAISEIEKYRAKSGREVLAVAGVCGPIEQAVKEAELAKRLGYDAVLLSPGGLNDRSEEYLVKRTYAVADVMDVIGFYLQPAVGGRIFTYDYWAKVCAVPGVKAIKCAGFSRYLTIDVARAIAFGGNRVALYTGNDDSIVTDLLTEFRFATPEGEKSVRVVGGLLGHWAVWTNTAVRYFHAVKDAVASGNMDPKWLTLAAQVTDANAAFFDTANAFAGCIAGIHEVLRRQGLMKGIWCLDPNETMSVGQSEEIDRVYAMYPELNDDAFVREFLKNDRA